MLHYIRLRNPLTPPIQYPHIVTFCHPLVASSEYSKEAQCTMHFITPYFMYPAKVCECRYSVEGLVDRQVANYRGKGVAGNVTAARVELMYSREGEEGAR